MNTLLAGATGHLGRHILPALKRRGHRVRALVRDPARLGPLAAHADEVRSGDLIDSRSVAGLCDGIDVVVSCAGASLDGYDFANWRSFEQVDFHGNAHLLAEARRARVGHFVYVSLFGAERLRGLEYVDAHERFVELLQSSGLAHTVVRPTGFFSFNAEFVRMAHKGRGLVVGDGQCYTNPVHEADVAEVCAGAVDGAGGDVPVGGPEVFTRRQVVELAFDALGKPPRLATVPPWVFRAAALVSYPVNRRMAGLMAFGAAVSQIELIAPAVGTRSLRAYFQDVAAALGRTN